MSVIVNGGGGRSVDANPTSGSNNPVSSGGVFTALSGKQDTLSLPLSTANGGTGNNSGYIRAGQKSGTTIGTGATAEGYNTEASGNDSHAEGGYTTASGNDSHAEGYSTTASGNGSHAEGNSTTASGNNSHAEGEDTTASGEASHAGGIFTTAGYEYQTVIGKYNDNKETSLFEVGNGYYDEEAEEEVRSNAFEVHSDGYISTGEGTKIKFDTSNNKYGYYDANGTFIAWVTASDVETAISNLPEPMIFKGTLGTGGTITTLPAAASSNEGFTYKVITAGTYASQSAKVGDVFVSNGSAWVIIPAGDEDTDTWRNVKVNGTELLGSAISTGALNLKNGSNVTITGSGSDVTIAATDTTYESKTAASGGTDVSLVTTGEKYTWNNKVSDSPTFSQASTRANLAGSGETFATILGKIKKFFADLGDLAFLNKDGTTGANYKYLRGDGSWQYFNDNLDPYDVNCHNEVAFIAVSSANPSGEPDATLSFTLQSAEAKYIPIMYFNKSNQQDTLIKIHLGFYADEKWLGSGMLTVIGTRFMNSTYGNPNAYNLKFEGGGFINDPFKNIVIGEIEQGTNAIMVRVYPATAQSIKIHYRVLHNYGVGAIEYVNTPVTYSSSDIYHIDDGVNIQNGVTTSGNAEISTDLDVGADCNIEGDLSVNGSVQLGTSTVGSSTQPVYINGGVPTAMTGALGTAAFKAFDNAPTSASDNLVISGGVYTALDNAKMKKTSQTVASSGWTASSYTSTSGTVYGYKKEVSLTGVTATSYVDISITSGTYTGAYCVESATDKVIIRTATQPSGSLTFEIYYGDGLAQGDIDISVSAASGYSFNNNRVKMKCHGNIVVGQMQINGTYTAGTQVKVATFDTQYVPTFNVGAVGVGDTTNAPVIIAVATDGGIYIRPQNNEGRVTISFTYDL